MKIPADEKQYHSIKVVDNKTNAILFFLEKQKCILENENAKLIEHTLCSFDMLKKLEENKSKIALLNKEISSLNNSKNIEIIIKEENEQQIFEIDKEF